MDRKNTSEMLLFFCWHDKELADRLVHIGLISSVCGVVEQAFIDEDLTAQQSDEAVEQPSQVSAHRSVSMSTRCLFFFFLLHCLFFKILHIVDL